MEYKYYNTQITYGFGENSNIYGLHDPKSLFCYSLNWQESVSVTWKELCNPTWSFYASSRIEFPIGSCSFMWIMVQKNFGNGSIKNLCLGIGFFRTQYFAVIRWIFLIGIMDCKWFLIMEDCLRHMIKHQPRQHWIKKQHSPFDHCNSKTAFVIVIATKWPVLTVLRPHDQASVQK